MSDSDHAQAGSGRGPMISGRARSISEADAVADLQGATRRTDRSLPHAEREPATPRQERVVPRYQGIDDCQVKAGIRGAAPRPFTSPPPIPPMQEQGRREPSVEEVFPTEIKNNKPFYPIPGRVFRGLQPGEPDAPDQIESKKTPWGNWCVLYEGGRYKVKRLMVLPGKQTSLQYHRHRDEHWVVVHGTAQVINADPRGADEMTAEELSAALGEYYLEEGQSECIASGSFHRLGNPGRVPLVVIETQYGSYLGEDDIVRVDPDNVVKDYYKPLLD